MLPARKVVVCACDCVRWGKMPATPDSTFWRSARELGKAVARAVRQVLPEWTCLEWGPGASGTRDADAADGDEALHLVVHVNDAGLAAGMALSSRPLSDRDFHATTLRDTRTAARQSREQAGDGARGAGVQSRGLRSTVCAAMVQLARVRDGETVLDPCCGSGSLLCEAQDARAALGPVALCALAMDCDEEALARARQALGGGNAGGAHGAVRGDLRRLPLRAECVDVLLADLPFGRQHPVPACAPLRARPSSAQAASCAAPASLRRRLNEMEEEVEVSCRRELPMVGTFLDEAGVRAAGQSPHALSPLCSASRLGTCARSLLTCAAHLLGATQRPRCFP